jgi:dihydropteroate synthase
MGVLNVTPDSFADGGRYGEPERAIEAALAMVEAGADIVDVGGESTRPGAAAVDAEEELRRVLPVVRGLSRQLHVPISIDTYKAGVADAALGEGAALVNDVSGLLYDPELAGVVARHQAGLVLMHTRGRSSEMYALANYDDVLVDVARELERRIEAAVAAGVSREAIVVDPGVGFAKKPDQSFAVLSAAGHPAFLALDRPVLVGPSRKSFLKAVLGDGAPGERVWGTAAAVTAAVLAGAHIVRVHDVKEMVQVVRVADKIRSLQWSRSSP